MSRILSIKSESSRVSRTKMYADLDLSLNFHPGLMDIRPIYDVDAVRTSVKNLILTGGGDHPFHPEIGSNIFGYLFENATKFTVYGISQAIEQVLARYEPRIDNVVVNMVDKTATNAFEVTIEFRVKAPDVDTEVSFFLERLR